MSLDKYSVSLVLCGKCGEVKKSHKIGKKGRSYLLIIINIHLLQ